MRDAFDIRRYTKGIVLISIGVWAFLTTTKLPPPDPVQKEPPVRPPPSDNACVSAHTHETDNTGGKPTLFIGCGGGF